MTTVLILNADKEVGSAVYQACYNSDWVVYSIQDKPPVVGITPILENWYQIHSTELTYYSEVLRAVDGLIRENVVFDHIILAEPVEDSKFTHEVELPWLLYRNSWGLAISRVLRQHKRLATKGNVVHLLPNSKERNSTLRLLNQLLRVVAGMYDSSDILVTLSKPVVETEISDLLDKLSGYGVSVGTSWDLTGSNHG